MNPLVNMNTMNTHAPLNFVRPVPAITDAPATPPTYQFAGYSRKFEEDERSSVRAMFDFIRSEVEDEGLEALTGVGINVTPDESVPGVLWAFEDECAGPADDEMYYILEEAEFRVIVEDNSFDYEYGNIIGTHEQFDEYLDQDGLEDLWFVATSELNASAEEADDPLLSAVCRKVQGYDGLELEGSIEEIRHMEKIEDAEGNYIWVLLARVSFS